MSDVDGAKKTVLVSALALLFIALYRDRQKPDEVALFRRVWGVGVLSVMLALAADFIPKIAGPFALLTVLGAMTQGGDKALSNVLANLGKKPAAGGGSGAGSTGDFAAGAKGDTGGGGNFSTSTGTTATDRAAQSNGRVGK